uniref:Zinc finger protein Rlf/292/654 TPR repeats domain-containing protein n=1 Tax=Timema douglasi TaxID=61478 RepID=A0A7R8VJC3_TIMDO|nr:unnamed protein product [Timema douglasi]
MASVNYNSDEVIYPTLLPLSGKRIIHYQMLYGGLTVKISDMCETLSDRVHYLTTAWHNLPDFAICGSVESTEHLAQCLYHYTVNLMLLGDWDKLSSSVKTHMSVTLKRSASFILNHPVGQKCVALSETVKEPWGHPTLKKIFDRSQDLSETEILDFCNSEKGFLLCTRLKVLCQSKTFWDMALELAETCVNCLRSAESRLHQESCVEEINYILDVYLALLKRFKTVQDVMNQLKYLSLQQGLELVRRYVGRIGSRIRVFKRSLELAKLTSEFFLAVAIVKPLSETGPILEDLMMEWALVHSRLPSAPQVIPVEIHKFVKSAVSAVTIYKFCEVLIKQFGEVLKPLCIELYITGLTIDLNVLQEHKEINDNGKIEETEERLSDGFLKLADLVKNSVWVCRECVLTAFSHNPTTQCFEKVKDMAIASGKCKCLPALDKINEDDYIQPTLRFEELKNLDEVLPSSDTVNCMSDQNINKEENVTPKLNGATICIQPTIQNNVFEDHEITIFNLTEKESSIKSSRDFENNVNKSTFETGQDDNKTTEPVNECGSHPSIDPHISSELLSLCSICGEFILLEASSPESESYETDILNEENSLEPPTLIMPKGISETQPINENAYSVLKSLGLDKHLCDDFLTVVGNRSYQMLHWKLDWKDLSILCEKYMANPEEMRNTKKELKYLNHHIDFNQFKNLPSDEVLEDGCIPGIEKGYEHCLDLNENPSSVQNSSLNSFVKRSKCSLDMSDTIKSKKTRKSSISEPRERKSNRLHKSKKVNRSSMRNKSNIDLTTRFPNTIDTTRKPKNYKASVRSKVPTDKEIIKDFQNSYYHQMTMDDLGLGAAKILYNSGPPQNKPHPFRGNETCVSTDGPTLFNNNSSEATKLRLCRPFDARKPKNGSSEILQENCRSSLANMECGVQPLVATSFYSQAIEEKITSLTPPNTNGQEMMVVETAKEKHLNCVTGEPQNLMEQVSYVIMPPNTQVGSYVHPVSIVFCVPVSRLTLPFHIGSNTDAKSNVLIGQESAPKPPTPLKDHTCKPQVCITAAGFSY